MIDAIWELFILLLTLVAILVGIAGLIVIGDMLLGIYHIGPLAEWWYHR